MSSINELYERIKFRSEDQVSWLGSYQQAIQENRFRHLTDECMICLTPYFPNDQLIVLPCSHALHERCFAPWTKQICPMDESPIRGLTKISALGHQLLLPPKTRALGTFAATHLNKINQSLLNQLSRMTDEKRVEFEKNIFDPNSKRIIQTIQDLLDAYDGKLPTYRISERAEESTSELITQFEECLESGEKREKLLSDLRKLNLSELNKTISLILQDEQKFVSGARLIAAICGVTIDSEGLHRLLKYVRHVFERLNQNPQFHQLAEELDQNFYLHHFKAIRELKSTFERYIYMDQMGSSNLQRLAHLTNGAQGPTSQTIRKAHSILSSLEGVRFLGGGLIDLSRKEPLLPLLVLAMATILYFE